MTILGEQAEKIVRVKNPDAEPILDKIRDQLYPLLREFNETTEKFWLPALADGQNGFVIDAKWKTRKWHEVLPQMDREMPIPEFGIILGVSDADKLGQALEAYRHTANKLIAKVRENVPPNSFPEFEIQKPKLDEKNGRKYAHYTLPKEWGFDKMLEPSGGVGGSVAALALSRGHVDRLLSPTPLPSNLAPLADPKKPMDSVFVVNFAELMVAVEPWVTFAIQKSNPADKKDAERIAPKVMSILKVFQSYSTATWRENGTTVTHSEAVLRDVPSGK